jgi:phosphoglycolate phosphatase
MNHHYHAVLLDLDGTLMDTAPDIANAIRQVQQTFSANTSQPFSLNALRDIVSYGSEAIIDMAFGLKPGDEHYLEIAKSILTTYQEVMTQEVTVFPGFLTVLDTLVSHNIPWGIVSNKPAHLIHPQLEHFGLQNSCQVVVGGDTYSERKPHPLPLLKACEQLNVRPEKTVYVGDCEHDMVAAKRAGLFATLATFGYVPRDQTYLQWSFDQAIAEPRDLLPLVGISEVCQ